MTDPSSCNVSLSHSGTYFAYRFVRCGSYIDGEMSTAEYIWQKIKAVAEVKVKVVT